MSIDRFQNKIEAPKIEVEPDFADFLPEEFKLDPIAYFEEKGVNIKSGEVGYHDDGTIAEDPTAAKDLPVWVNSKGQILSPVAKRVNIDKAQIKKTNDPFYEYKIIEFLQELGLPAPKPIVKVEQSGIYIFVMERIPGLRWINNDIEQMRVKGYSREDLENLEAEANEMMLSLSERYGEIGIVRSWKLRDMILDIDFENKKLRSITPVDWERTKLDIEKISKAKDKYQNKTELPTESEMTFEVRNEKEGVTAYVFKNLAVAIDTTGKNYKPLPELFFGPYDNELNIGSLNQPEKTKQGVDMEYVAECIKTVAAASGISQFWFYPFGDDSPTEDMEVRKKARMRLFSKVASNILPAPEGHGYILTV